MDGEIPFTNSNPREFKHGMAKKGKLEMRAPKRFVSLHNHSGASTYDGLGPVETHFDFCMENGLDAHAITEHGHMNSYAAAQLYYEKLKDKGVPFKYIPGVEAYVHPDLDEWAQIRQDRKEEIKRLKNEAKKRGEDPETIDDIDGNNQLTVENEEASKQKKFDPINRRHHMVVLPKTPEALQKIYGLVSYGYLDGFYRYPRMDAKAIKAAANGDGDIILSTACIGGPFAYEIFGSFDKADWDDLTPIRLRELDPAGWQNILRRIGNVHDLWADAVGDKNLFLELQFNKLPQQDLVNLVLIKYAERFGLLDRLIVTCDAHYPGPDKWVQREMYKKLGYMNYQELNPESLPKSVDDLKAELYPKNAQQIWEEYLRSRSRLEDEYFRYDEIICDAIERTHDIAHDVIMETPPDRTAKFPSSVVKEDSSPMRELVTLARQGLIERSHADKPEYVARMKMELGVMKELEVPLYFITLARIMQLAREKVLTGPCRGSGGGSLVNYCLGITDVDPIKYDLFFSRFMSVHRKGMPDVDIDIDDRDTVLEELRKEFGYTNVVPISNYNLLKLKSLTKDVCKFFGVPFDEVNAAMRTVEDDVRKATLKEGDDKNLFQLTFDEAMKHSPSYREFIEKLAEDYPSAVESIRTLYKEQRSLGRHAGGVLVVDDLRNKMPLITSDGEPQSPWVEGMAVKHLEKIGNFIKYDLLGLLTLRLIRRTIGLILEKKVRIVVGNTKFAFDPDTNIVLSNGTAIRANQITEGVDIDDEWILTQEDAIIK